MNGWIMTGVAPFSEVTIPLQSLNLFNNSQDPNGTWNFIVTDLFIPADTGSFHYVNLTFSINPPADPTSTSGPCSDTNLEDANARIQTVLIVIYCRISLLPPPVSYGTIMSIPDISLLV